MAMPKKHPLATVSVACSCLQKIRVFNPFLCCMIVFKIEACPVSVRCLVALLVGLDAQTLPTDQETQLGR